MTDPYRAVKRAVKAGCFGEAKPDPHDHDNWFVMVGKVKCAFDDRVGYVTMTTPGGDQYWQSGISLIRMLRRRGVTNPYIAKPIEEYLQCP